MAKKKEITVVLVKPNEKAVIAKIESSLEGMQNAVGGYIQAVYPYEEEVAIICNEEGKISGLPLNRSLTDEDGEIYDIIAGDFFIADCSGEDFDSLSPDKLEKYKNLFLFPEKFFKINDKIKAVKCETL